MVALSYYPDDPRIRRESETLARAGYAIDILCLRNQRQPKVEHFGSIIAHRIVEGMNKERLFFYLWLSTKFMVAAFIHLNKLRMRRQHALIHVHNLPDHLVFVGLWQKVRGLPIILDLHDLTVELFESKWRHRRGRVMRPLLKMVEKLSCGFADELITTSIGFKERLSARGVQPEKITLILNSADERIFRNQWPREFTKSERGTRLLYHGTVAERFGLDVAIDALAKVQQVIPETTLSIYGKYDTVYRAQLEAQVTQLGLSDRVHFGDYLQLEEIREIIAKSDIGIVPYRSDGFMDLALSTKTFEYVTMQLPVVASRLPALQNIFDSNCIRYFEPGRAVELAEKIIEFCLNPALRRSCAERARQAYQANAWPVME
ncbi:MAG TPA: glycosyltransferase family 4 protein, partial [bacterium]